MSKIPELKPCPLCAGEAKFLSAKFAPIGILHGIECTDCGLWLDCRERSQKGAAAVWNHRVIPTRKQELKPLVIGEA